MALDGELKRLLESKWSEIEEETIQLLQKLIKVDTQNMQEEGTEIAAVRLLEGVFQEAGIEYDVIEPKSGRGNIIARIQGDGSSGNGALLLSSHLDTVKAPKENWEAEGWKHDPYGGIIDEEDGCLYGRGAIDMKNMAAMSVVLLCFVKKNGIILSRDLIFAGIADEERTDSKWGIKYLVENRPELIEADIVFNEVGGFTMSVQGTEAVVVQIAEKGSMQVKITAHGPGGHGSLYHKTNPITTIGQVAHTLQTNRLPLRINQANTTTINGLADCLPFPKSYFFRYLLSPTFSRFLADNLVPPLLQSSLLPLLHNTANPTSIGGGGGQHNQIPTSAWLMIDSRYLPECTHEGAVDDIKKVIGPERFEEKVVDGVKQAPELTLEVLAYRDPQYQDTSCPVYNEVMGVIRDVVRDYIGAPVSPTLIPGGTDSFYYSKHPTKTPVCIGFTPIRFEPEVKFSDLFHGTNERVPVSGLKWGVKVFAEVVHTLCESKLIK